jgi:hypothetical protein
MRAGLPQCKPKKKTSFSKWANLSRRVLQLMKESSSIEGVGRCAFKYKENNLGVLYYVR